jgi:surfeit locus 1 family protein
MALAPRPGRGAPRPPRYRGPVLRLALRPKWIVGHLLVLAMAFTCVQLGLWQLRRLDEKRDRIDLVRAAQAEPAVPVEQLLAADDPRTGPVADAAAFRTVTATGTYDLDHEILVRNRPLDGVNGNDVVTPLVLADGTAVLVTRGWVPFEVPGDRPLPGAEPPAPTVTVTGVLQRTERGGGLAPEPAPDGDLGTVGHLDVGAVADSLPYPVLPLTVLLEEQVPAQPGDFPAPVDADEPGEGPHLSYAIQWFTFATLALVIWPLVLRKAARKGAAPSPATDDATPDPEPAAASSR